MSFIEDALTPQGTNAAASQNRRNAKLANALMTLVPGLQELAQRQLTYGTGLEDKRQASLDQLISSLSPGSMAGSIKAQTNSIYSNASEAARRASAMARGMGSGYNLGQGINFGKSAALQASNVEQNLYDPQKRAQMLASLVDAIQGGQNVNLTNLAQIGATLNGQQPVQVQPGFGQILGNMASGIVGAATTKGPPLTDGGWGAGISQGWGNRPGNW